MDVLLFYPALFHRGGSERVVLELARKFNAPVYTAAYDPSTTFSEFSGCEVNVMKVPALDTAIGALRGNQMALPGAIGAKFLFHKVGRSYDVINAHGTPTNWVRNRNERVCWYFYAPVRSAFDLYTEKVAALPFHKRLFADAMIEGYKFVERRVDSKIEKVVSVSEYVNVRDAAFLRDYVGKEAAPVPPGVDYRNFGSEQYEKYFLCISRIAPEKRFEYAIDAFRRFSASEKGWRLVIAGHLSTRTKDAEYLAELKEMSEGLRVEFVIAPDEARMKDLYANSYAVLFCAVREDLGLVPLEAMASEKPCISVNEGGPAYTILDGETGFLVDRPEKMAEKMLYLAGNPDENERMGREGRKRVLENYTWDIFFRKMEAAFRETAKAD